MKTLLDTFRSNRLRLWIANRAKHIPPLLVQWTRTYGPDVQYLLKKVLPRKPLSPQEQQREHEYITSLQVNPYDYITCFKPINIQVIDESYSPNDVKIPFSTATTIYNENRAILTFLKSLERQSVQPSEVILVDGGSTDTTIAHIKRFMKHSKLPIRLFQKHGLNIPQGRNSAIQHASSDLIVLADAGTILDKDYCKNIAGYFASHDDADLVGGTFYAMRPSKYAQFFIPNWEQKGWHPVDWNFFLPSTRALALKKSTIEREGYYPEYLQTGDDTLFDINLRKHSSKWVFNKKAFVLWDCPFTKSQFEKVQHNYGKGDGRSGFGDAAFYSFRSLEKRRLPISDPLARMLYYRGYLEGRKERLELEVTKLHIKGVIFLLTDYPLSDRTEWLILCKVRSMIRERYKVIYIHLYPSKESLQDKKYLNLDFSLLELYHVNDLDLENLMDLYSNKISNVQVHTYSTHPYFKNRL